MFNDDPVATGMAYLIRHVLMTQQPDPTQSTSISVPKEAVVRAVASGDDRSLVFRMEPDGLHAHLMTPADLERSQAEFAATADINIRTGKHGRIMARWEGDDDDDSPGMVRTVRNPQADR